MNLFIIGLIFFCVLMVALGQLPVLKDRYKRQTEREEEIRRWIKEEAIKQEKERSKVVE